MVLSENRPENRFIVMQKLDDVVKETINTIKSVQELDEYHSMILQALIKMRQHAATYNICNIYDPRTLSLRKEYQTKTLHELYNLKAILDVALLMMDPKRSKELSKIYRLVDIAVTSVKLNQKSDAARAAKGKDLVKKEFEEAKHKQFFKEETVDNTKVLKGALEAKDPFDVKKLIFKKTENKD